MSLFREQQSAFTQRHIGTIGNETEMLEKIGISSLDELLDKTIPESIRLRTPLQLPEACS